MSLAGLGFALASSVVWGTADFAGGLLTKRLPTFGVTLVSQAAGFVVLIAAVAWRGDVGSRSFMLGTVGGIGGGLGLAAFYRALSLGTMSIVSPIAACGAVVPVVIALATGERPSAIALGGAAAAFAGAVLASVEERRGESPERARAVLLAVAAALALGVFIYFLGLGSREGDVLSTLFGARVGSLTTLLVLAAALRAPVRFGRSFMPAVVAVGLADVSANALFAVASSRGLLALVAVLGSLYPVVTVILAHVFLRERLTRTQKAGIGMAMAGVVAIAGA